MKLSVSKTKLIAVLVAAVFALGGLALALILGIQEAVQYWK